VTIEPLTPQALALFVGQYVGKKGEEAFGDWLLIEAHHAGWLATHFRPAILSTNREGKPRYATAISGDEGFFDWVLMRRGRIIFAELKVDHGKLSKDQQAWFEAGEIPAARNGGGFGIYQDNRTEFHLWRPSHRDEILRVLE
jgi:hypothetical protein